ncbi:hypothetical protein EVG20_g5007 [Dentipellis fragilis]|uniref:Uncharacterized protein n=1 Tax=Dentipellis fragilis TaxID=205917 RepID=A0A4Y9YU35_9AGAM|nr:hypothetical protein EVG20_g5007 [Dentipellis fragilis]
MPPDILPGVTSFKSHLERIRKESGRRKHYGEYTHTSETIFEGEGAIGQAWDLFYDSLKIATLEEGIVVAEVWLEATEEWSKDNGQNISIEDKLTSLALKLEQTLAHVRSQAANFEDESSDGLDLGDEGSQSESEGGSTGATMANDDCGESPGTDTNIAKA